MKMKMARAQAISFYPNIDHRVKILAVHRVYTRFFPIYHTMIYFRDVEYSVLEHTPGVESRDLFDNNTALKT